MISIIIPFYNSERYLLRCLTSVLNQSYSDWEAILIDDGSTDDGLQIALEFLNADKRFKVIQQERNLGPSAARNRGMAEAKGEYLTFLDSDDWWDSDFLERMLQSSGPYDMIRCGFKRVSGNHILYKQRPLHNWQFSTVWGCLFKSGAVKSIHFQEGYRYEDVLWTADFLMQHPKNKIINYYGYNYRQNPSSFTSGIHKNDADRCMKYLRKKELHPVIIYILIKHRFHFCFFNFVTSMFPH